MGLFDFLKKDELDEAPMPEPIGLPQGIPQPPSAPEIRPVGEQQIPHIPESPDVPDSIPDLELPEPPLAQGSSAQIIEPAREEPLTGPVFLKMDQFKQAMIGVGRAKESLRAANNHFDDITVIKNDQDKVLEKLRTTLEDMERKLLYVDKTLFEGGEQ